MYHNIDIFNNSIFFIVFVKYKNKDSFTIIIIYLELLIILYKKEEWSVQQRDKYL